MKLLLAAPRGFCAGVEMAIASLEKALALYGAPIYVYHQIVHNQFLVSRYEARGVVFVDSLEEVPAGSRLLFSAHGVAPQVREEAVSRNFRIIDATCPLVTKVHAEARRFANEGRTIFFIGHKHHDEAVGVVGEAPNNIVTIGRIDDIENLPPELQRQTRTAYLTQTTLGVDDTAHMINALRQKFPDVVGPPQSDICYATQNRQEAVRVLLPEADVTIVIGSTNSSNSQRLAETARVQGKPAYLVDGPDEVVLDWFDQAATILLTAGASVSHELVEAMVEWLGEHLELSVEERLIQDESVHFKLPLELR